MIRLSEELKNSFAGLELESEDNISFDYHIAENGAYVIESIEKTSK
ncbi:MAG: hypothetical protein GX820_02290 [Bacteroidales bacterium]|nr:hypothetical protein [Bacteroidales bacterium]